MSIHANYWKDFTGMTIRTYDPQTGLWRLYWLDNHFSHGVIQPPVTGRFNGNAASSRATTPSNGKPIVVRFIWTGEPQGLESGRKLAAGFFA